MHDDLNDDQYRATETADKWVRKMAAVLQAANVLPIYHARVLWIPSTRLWPRKCLHLAELVLSLWNNWHKTKPFTNAQTWAYKLCRAVDQRSELDHLQCRYIGHVCAKADTLLIKALFDELILTNQVLLPKEFQNPDEDFIFPLKSAQALADTKRARIPLIINPEILP